MSKNEKKGNSNINCNVDSCKYNNCEEGTCNLEEISVSCTCDKDACCDCDETICASFETSSGPITDTEYEVQAEIEEYPNEENEEVEATEDNDDDDESEEIEPTEKEA